MRIWESGEGQGSGTKERGSRAVERVLRACRFGLAGGCVKKLKTMVILGLRCVRRSRRSWGFGLGEAAGADL